MDGILNKEKCGLLMLKYKALTYLLLFRVKNVGSTAQNDVLTTVVQTARLT